MDVRQQSPTIEPASPEAVYGYPLGARSDEYIPPLTPADPAVGFPGEGRVERFLAAALLIGLTMLWAWWGIEEGAFFPDVMYPGMILIGFALIGLLWVAPIRILPNNPFRVTLGALFFLAGWTLLSLAWTPARDEALVDGMRVVAYLGLFLTGLWATHLLGSRMRFAPVPVALGGLAVGIAVAVASFLYDDAERLLIADRLAYPLGYANATAAILIIGAIAALGMAIQPLVSRPLRIGMGGIASFCIALAVLSQSRGAAVAGMLAFATLVLLSQWRTRSLIHLLVVLAPAAIALPFLLDVFSTATDDGDVTGALRAATAAAVAAGLLGALFTAATVIGEKAAAKRRRDRDMSPRMVAALWIGAVVATLGLVFTFGDPSGWIEERVTEFNADGPPETTRGDSTRVSFNVQSGRSDFWRVASEDFASNPLLGSGAGGFQYSYLLEGETGETPRDSHSVFMDSLGELGLPGLTALIVALAAMAIGALRSRPLGPGAAGLSAISLALLVYWTIHAGVDWFWTYPAITGPVFALAGAAAAPALRGLSDRTSGGSRVAIGALVGLVALICMPLFVSERLVDNARSSWEEDLSGAYSKLGTAADLNPFVDAPFLLEGEIARNNDSPARALTAFDRASERQPEEWASYYFKALVLFEDHPQKAKGQLRKAAELFPKSPEIRRANRLLRSDP